MKAVWSIGLCMFLLTACLREHDNMEDCRADLFFKMQAVPYVFEGREFAGYRSYYFFVEQLDLFLFESQVFFGVRVVAVLTRSETQCHCKQCKGCRS